MGPGFRGLAEPYAVFPRSDAEKGGKGGCLARKTGLDINRIKEGRSC